MSQRAFVRAIAKARMKAMDVPHVNRAIGLRMSHTRNQNLQRTRGGRKQLMKIQKQYPPLWRRVTSGTLAADGYRAQIGIGRKRRFRVAQ